MHVLIHKLIYSIHWTSLLCSLLCFTFLLVLLDPFMVSLQTSQKLTFTTDFVTAMARALLTRLGPLILTLHSTSELGSEWTWAGPVVKPTTSVPREEQGQGLGQQRGQKQLKDREEQKPVKGTGQHQCNLTLMGSEQDKRGRNQICQGKGRKNTHKLSSSQSSSEDLFCGNFVVLLWYLLAGTPPWPPYTTVCTQSGFRTALGLSHSVWAPSGLSYRHVAFRAFCFQSAKAGTCGVVCCRSSWVWASLP